MDTEKTTKKTRISHPKQARKSLRKKGKHPKSKEFLAKTKTKEFLPKTIGKEDQGMVNILDESPH